GPQSDLVINDSLVKDLKCATLSGETVLTSLQPDAFDSTKDLQIRNWPDVIGIGHCWSLSHAQRLVYFLGRTGSSSVSPIDRAMFRNPLARLHVFQMYT